MKKIMCLAIIALISNTIIISQENPSYWGEKSKISLPRNPFTRKQTTYWYNKEGQSVGKDIESPSGTKSARYVPGSSVSLEQPSWFSRFFRSTKSTPIVSRSVQIGDSKAQLVGNMLTLEAPGGSITSSAKAHGASQIGDSTAEVKHGSLILSTPQGTKSVGMPGFWATITRWWYSH